MYFHEKINFQQIFNTIFFILFTELPLNKTDIIRDREKVRPLMMKVFPYQVYLNLQAVILKNLWSIKHLREW